MGSDPSPGRKRRVPPPPGLEVRRVTTGPDSFLVFSWTPAPAKNAADLTSAECEVLDLIVSGCSNRQIAAARGVSVRTVANQVASILRKSSARSRVDLMRRHATGAKARLR